MASRHGRSCEEFIERIRLWCSSSQELCTWVVRLRVCHCRPSPGGGGANTGPTPSTTSGSPPVTAHTGVSVEDPVSLPMLNAGPQKWGNLNSEELKNSIKIEQIKIGDVAGKNRIEPHLNTHKRTQITFTGSSCGRHQRSHFHKRYLGSRLWEGHHHRHCWWRWWW